MIKCDLPWNPGGILYEGWKPLSLAPIGVRSDVGKELKKLLFIVVQAFPDMVLRRNLQKFPYVHDLYSIFVYLHGYGVTI
ncbi:hypothetical protein Tco_1523214 [Tanacetum coccineum]